jgi:hypothetical protein
VYDSLDHNLSTNAETQSFAMDDKALEMSAFQIVENAVKQKTEILPTAFAGEYKPSTPQV